MNEELSEKELISRAMSVLGSRKSEAKAKSSVANGKKGGRPRKKPLETVEEGKEGEETDGNAGRV